VAAQSYEHTAGIYGFFAALAQAARQQPGQCLGWGRQVRCANGATGGGAAAPSSARCAGGISGRMQQLCFWLEWDRGTMNARDVAVKFDAYRHYTVSREWARERLGLPSLLYVAPGIAQKRRMHLVAQGCLPQPPGPAAWTTDHRGPVANAWPPCAYFDAGRSAKQPTCIDERWTQEQRVKLHFVRRGRECGWVQTKEAILSSLV